MGFGLQRFVSAIDDNLICGICSAVFEDAVLTSCGHAYCLICLRTWVERGGRIRNNGRAPPTCPECRAPCSLELARPIHAVRNLINALEVNCSNDERGCKVVVRLELLPHHLEECAYAATECARCGLTINRYELPAHHAMCVAIIGDLADDMRGADDRDDEDDDEDNDDQGFRKNRQRSKFKGKTFKSHQLESRLRDTERELAATKKRNEELARRLSETEAELGRKEDELRRRSRELVHERHHKKKVSEEQKTSEISEMEINARRINSAEPVPFDRSQDTAYHDADLITSRSVVGGDNRSDATRFIDRDNVVSRELITSSDQIDGHSVGTQSNSTPARDIDAGGNSRFCRRHHRVTGGPSSAPNSSRRRFEGVEERLEEKTGFGDKEDQLRKIPYAWTRSSNERLTSLVDRKPLEADNSALTTILSSSRFGGRRVEASTSEFGSRTPKKTFRSTTPSSEARSVVFGSKPEVFTFTTGSPLLIKSRSQGDVNQSSDRRKNQRTETLTRRFMNESASLISRYLLCKPSMIDRYQIFATIRRGFHEFGHFPSNDLEATADLYKLLVTAAASNWFGEEQRQEIDVWLKSLAEKGLPHD